MNYYTTNDGSKIYVLDPIKKNYNYFYHLNQYHENYIFDEDFIIKNLIHRIDGPAIEWIAGQRHWYLYGRMHREDGPAVMFESYKSWWYHGTKIDCNSQEEFEKIMKMKAFL